MKHLSLLLLVFFSCVQFYAQTEEEKVAATISKEKIEGHIYFLADDLLKGRETGTPENKIAASYLANSFRKYGVEPNPKTGDYYQEVHLQKVSPPKQVQLQINGTEMDEKVPLESAEMQFQGDAVFLDQGLEEDYEGKDVSGKMVIVQSASFEDGGLRAAFGMRNRKSSLAKEAGAIGVVEFVQSDNENWEFLEHYFNTAQLEVANDEPESSSDDFVYFWVKDSKGQTAGEFASGDDLQVNLEIGPDDKEKIISRNVIGIVEGTDLELRDEYIIYSAHYDHVGIGEPDETGDSIYNGARDNAVGTTTVLSMAENLTRYPTKRSALFILFTGEEKGLLGSKYYVDNPVLPLEQMVYAFNSDNAGYNDTSVATIIGLERTTVADHIKEATSTYGITAIDDPAPEQGLFDRSDNVHFAAKGIPAPTFSLGFRAFDGDVTKYYHQPGDEAHTLDYDYLYNFFRAYVLSGRLIANDPETPFWTEGDKYEPAGKELYDRE